MQCDAHVKQKESTVVNMATNWCKLIQNEIQCGAQHMAKGEIAHDGIMKWELSDELFKMLVIKWELVIKIKTRENEKAGAYAQEVNVRRNESGRMNQKT